MKYLHDDRLAELTKALTDCPVGGAVSQRLLHGRLEAYTMKRGTDDKKYAFKLGEKFVASLENRAEDVSMIEKVSRKRSQSAGMFEDTKPVVKAGRRSRSSSFDTTGRPKATVDPLKNLLPTSLNRSMPSALGDFAMQGTRRLMTDLILTLNMSFPDFDFGDVQPTDFFHMSVRNAIDRINVRLSDLALNRETFLLDLWSAIDSVIHLGDCDVYSYQPNDGDPFFLAQTLTEDSLLLQNTRSQSPTDKNTTTDGSLQSDAQVTTIWSFNYFFVNKTAKRILLFTCVECMRSYNDDNSFDDPEDYVPSIVVEDSAEMDFDLDPAAAPAGGIPISTI